VLMARLRAAARPSFEAWYRETTPTRAVPEVMGRLLKVT
jgi:hypothetical protein